VIKCYSTQTKNVFGGDPPTPALDALVDIPQHIQGTHETPQHLFPQGSILYIDLP
jgi:hypothetical protein